MWVFRILINRESCKKFLNDVIRSLPSVAYLEELATRNLIKISPARLPFEMTRKANSFIIKLLCLKKKLCHIKQLDVIRSLPLVVYTPQGGTKKSALKGCLPRPNPAMSFRPKGEILKLA